MADTVSLTLSEVSDLAEKAFSACGASAATARVMAEAVVGAERDGIPSHGLNYVPVYCEHLRCGKVDGKAEPEVRQVSPAGLVADAREGFAHPAIAAGFARLIPLAREMGIAGLAVRNSYNCGVLGHHVERLAEAGLLGIGFTNAPASIAPVGGTKAVIGTNPIACAVPDGEGGASILIDQSSSVVAKSEVIVHAKTGEPIPLGWALDPDGKPTTDADVALKGTMAPSGGYKGFGQGLIVEIMAAALSGATLGIHASPFGANSGGPPRTGQFFLAMAPDGFSGGAFGARLADLQAAILSQPGARLPGSRRVAARHRIEQEGVTPRRDLYERAKSYTEPA